MFNGPFLDLGTPVMYFYSLSTKNKGITITKHVPKSAVKFLLQVIGNNRIYGQGDRKLGRRTQYFALYIVKFGGQIINSRDI